MAERCHGSLPYETSYSRRSSLARPSRSGNTLASANRATGPHRAEPAPACASRRQEPLLAAWLMLQRA